MRVFSALCFFPVLAVGSIGCGPSPTTPPLLGQVVKVRLVVKQSPGSGGPCDTTLTEGPDCTAVLDWLKGIDWSQEGTDLSVVKVPEPDGRILLTTKDGATHEFGFFWDGRFINEPANRLIRAGNLAGLKQLVQRLCQ